MGRGGLRSGKLYRDKGFSGVGDGRGVFGSAARDGEVEQPIVNFQLSIVN
jgi:hypothetical protein